MMKGRRGTQPHFLPTAKQELLLGAALLPPPEALENWKAWNEQTNINAAGAGALRLFAHVFQNLRGFGLDDGPWNRIKGVYQQNWVRSQRLAFAGEQILKGMENLGVSVMLLKGAAHLAQKFEGAGTRIMSDMDIMVRREDVPLAAKALIYLGWNPHESFLADPECRESQGYMDACHSGDFSNPGLMGIDLHWRLLPPYYLNGTGGEFWERALPVKFRGADVLVPSLAAQLFHTCVHGTRWSQYFSLYWIVDALHLLRARGGELDWNEFIGLARDHHAAVPLQMTVPYLINRWGAPIPSHVMETLMALPVSKWDRVMFDYTHRHPPGGKGFYPLMWRWPGGILDFTQKYYALNNKWQCLFPGYFHRKMYHNPKGMKSA